MSPYEPVLRKALSPTPVSLVKRSLDAQGGLEITKKALSSYTLETQGTRWGERFKGRVSWKAPGTLLISRDGGDERRLLTPKGCWIQSGGISIPCPLSSRRELEASAWGTHLSHLYPLLTPEVKLTRGRDAILVVPSGRSEKGSKSSGTSNRSTRITTHTLSATSCRENKKLPKVTLYFSPKTGLLLALRFHRPFSRDGRTTHRRRSSYRLLLLERHKKSGGVRVPRLQRLLGFSRVLVKERIRRFIPRRFAEDEAKAAQSTPWGQKRIRTLPTRGYVFSRHAGRYASFFSIIAHTASRMRNDGLVMDGPAEVTLEKPLRTIRNIKTIPLMVRIPYKRVRPTPQSPGGLVTQRQPARKAATMATRGTLAQALDRLYRLKRWARRKGHDTVASALRVFPKTESDSRYRPYELLIFLKTVPTD